MSADDLTDEEVIDRFGHISDINSKYLDLKEEYKSEILDEKEDSIRDRIEKGIEQDKKHDNLLKQTISAFLPGGPIETETGWTFLGSEPLSEKQLTNADALFGNPDRNMVLLVECKTSDGRPTNSLEQIYDAAAVLREKREHLEEKVGMTIDDVECAICIPSVADRRIVEQIEEHEENGFDEERVFIWRIHHFDGETLDLYTDLSTREGGERTHNSELAQILSSGVALTYGRQVIPAYFPSSHLEVVMEEIFSKMLEIRLQDGGSLRYFTGQELLSELTSQRNLPHYDAEIIGERIYTKLVNRCKDFNLIEEIPPSESDLERDDDETYFKYRVRGKSIETIVTNLKNRYITKAIERQAGLDAKRRVIDDFDEEQSVLGDF